MAYLSCKDLAVGYAGTPVAQGIGFVVESADLLCVIGENGTGKSTLVKTLLGLVPPILGTVELGDGLSPQDVGYLPQQGDTQRDFPAAAGEIVLSGRLAHLGRRPFFTDADRGAARLALDRVDALPLYRRAFSELSGGQQQRVLLARALCGSARLIVLDEPTNGLDPKAVQALYALLDTLRADGLALIVVTHDVREALAHATHVLTLGTQAAFGTIDSYRTAREGSVA